jgi:hypothetical protein
MNEMARELKGLACMDSDVVERLEPTPDELLELIWGR